MSTKAAQDFGIRLRKTMDDRETNSLELAKALGIRWPTMQRYAQGKTYPRSQDNLRRIASKLKVRLHWLMEGEGEQYPNGWEPAAVLKRKEERATTKVDRQPKRIIETDATDTVADRLLFIMAEKGWNTSQTARYIGMQPTQFTRYVKGTQVPGPKVMGKIAKELGISLMWLQRGAVVVAHRREQKKVTLADGRRFDRLNIDEGKILWALGICRLADIAGADRESSLEFGRLCFALGAQSKAE